MTSNDTTSDDITTTHNQVPARGETSFPAVEHVADLQRKLGVTDWDPTNPVVPLEPSTTELGDLARDGYIILDSLLDSDQLDTVRSELNPMFDRTGRNDFEGTSTRRVYGALSQTRALDPLISHPRVLGLLGHVLDVGYLLSQVQAIDILPGETPQLLHHDDGIYPSPRPRPPLGAATIWAIDAFGPENGSTRVIPGSHQWGDEQPSPTDIPVLAEMSPGSCIFFLGTLWHGGGPNQSPASRLAVTAQYCRSWLRPQEAFTLSVDRDVARTLPHEIQSMVGYSIHPPFVGMVDGRHPRRLL